MSNVKSKSASAKKVTPKASTVEKETPVTPEQRRHQMIAEAAYFRTEKRDFVGGDIEQDWLEAEVEIDRMLQQASKQGQEDMISKQAFQQKLEAHLKEWDVKFEELKAKGQEAKAEIRADIEKQRESLSDKREVAQTKLLELRHRTEEAWEDLKTDAEKTWEEMQEALNRFVSHFK